MGTRVAPYKHSQDLSRVSSVSFFFSASRKCCFSSFYSFSGFHLLLTSLSQSSVHPSVSRRLLEYQLYSSHILKFDYVVLPSVCNLVFFHYRFLSFFSLSEYSFTYVSIFETLCRIWKCFGIL